MKSPFYYTFLLFFLLPSIFSPSTLADITNEIAKNIQRARQLIPIKPKAVLKETIVIRNKYKDKLTDYDQLLLFDIDAWAHLYNNEHQLALSTIKKVNSLASAKKDIFQWNINNTKANIYAHMGESQKALSHHLIAYELIKNDPLNLSERMLTENNIGYISVQLGFYQEALPYLKRVLAYYLTTGNYETLAIAYNNLGEALFHLGQVEQAFTYHQKSLAIRIEHKLNFHASYSYHNLGLVYFYRKNYNQAKAHFIKAINIRADSNYIRGLLESQLALAKVYQATQINILMV